MRFQHGVGGATDLLGDISQRKETSMSKRTSEADQMFDDERLMEGFLLREARIMTLREIIEVTGMPQTRAVGALSRLNARGGALMVSGGWCAPGLGLTS